MTVWYRVRYDDQGRDLSAAVRHLNSLAQQGLEVLWIVNRGDPALLVSCDTGREALLTEGLLNLLPGARLAPEEVSGFWSDFPTTQYIVGHTPPAPLVPDMLIDMKADTALHIVWTGGRMGCPVLRTRADWATATAVVKQKWSGARLLPFNPPWIKFGALPSQMFSMPSSERCPTLASHNAREIAFVSSQDVEGGILIGSDASERPVMVQRPARIAWVGSTARLNYVAAWLSSKWERQIVVLDGSGHVGKGWQDVEKAQVFVAWSLPGKSTRINPLARLAQESLDEYAQRVMAWFAAMNVNQSLLGARGVELVRVCVKLAAAGLATGEIDPSLAPNLLVATDSYALLDPQTSALNETELAVWRSRDARNDVVLFAPAVALIRGVFDRSPEMSMWLPPYTPVETLNSSKWIIFRVPVQTNNQRMYWAGMWPLLKQVLARPDTLVLAFGLGALGRAALSMSVRGASVLAWGRTLQDAVGTQDAVTLGHVDLIVGAGADPSHFGRILRPAVKDELARNLPHILASQSDEQAVARIGKEVGSIRFQIPKSAHYAQSKKEGWATGDGLVTPPVVSVMGDEPFARAAVVSLIARSVNDGHRVMLLGNRDLWGELESLGAVTLSMRDMPMLNPLEPRNPKRWVWWGSGLGLPAALMQNAYRAGVTTLQGLLDYLQSSDKPETLGSSIGVVQEALKTKVFGVAESDPKEWLAEINVLAVETYHPALTRTMAAAAVDAGARLVCWNCPGFTAADLALLNKSSGLVWPDTLWVRNVLVMRTSNGAAKVLPEGLRPLVKTLAAGEAYLYRRGSDEYYKVGVA